VLTLRRKLERAAPGQPVETVPGVGYRLADGEAE
jgi:DNA-binding response OmpR family regulator